MNPEDFQQKAGEAFELLEAENFTKAFLGFKKLTQKSPHVAQIWMGYGSAALWNGDNQPHPEY